MASKATYVNGHAGLQGVQSRILPNRLVELELDLGRPPLYAAKPPARKPIQPKPAPEPVTPAVPAVEKRPKAPQPPARKKNGAAAAARTVAGSSQPEARKATGGKGGQTSQAEPPAGTTKKDHVLFLLRRQQGATLPDLTQATGWQSHYADVRIMPTCVGNPACGAVIAAMESA